MGAAKWIGGILGFIIKGPLGALAGYALGSLFDSDTNEEENAQNTSSRRQTYTSAHDEFTAQRNSFLFSMLVMASYIIKADGKVMHSEMECVRRFLRTNFGSAAVEQGNEILLNLFEQRKRMDAISPYAFRKKIQECGYQIAMNMGYSERLQLLSFLIDIARADRAICSAEIDALKEVATSMHIDTKDVDSLLNLGGNSLEDAYKVLEITPDATDAEVKAAYRAMALKHHPDKVATLGEDVKKAAEAKFQRINDAKERIYKARGIK